MKAKIISLIIRAVLVLNLGTSAQLCLLSMINRIASSPLITKPFFGETKIIVAASMNGGNAINLIAEACDQT